MENMFNGASAFNQDLDWCLDVEFEGNEFSGTQCASTSCGVVQSSNCPTPRPTGSDTVDAASRLSGVSAALLVLALAA